MISFEKSFNKTIKYEGGYSNNKFDKGGETYMGISKVYNPDWKGWKLLDKNDSSDKIFLLVKEYYRTEYWDKIKGDKLQNQKIADKVFDVAVNMGKNTSIKFLQKGLNLLNRNQKNYKNIKVDGIIGNKTLEALKYYLKNDSYIYLLKIINILQGNKYIKIVENNKSQEKFIRGWLKRIEL